jgi:hypothetical protein
MAEREVVLDQPVLVDEQAEALRQATERAERAEAELAKLKSAAAHTPASGGDALKTQPSPNTGENAAGSGDRQRAPEQGTPEGGEAELRKDSMMAHLLDSLEAGKDIGHYGRLVFAMVARHFLPHDEVLAWMMKDRDVDEEKARLMLRQVEGRDYNPPRRDKILAYQAQQEFPILPFPDDPDCGNLYRNLKFPDEVYEHIGHYQEAKMESEV